MMFIAIASIIVPLDWLANSERLINLIERSQQEESRTNKTSFWSHGFYLDRGDQLLLSELPQVDSSQGGVYLIGASNVETLGSLWDFEPHVKRYLHNFGVGATSPEMQCQFVRYLVGREGPLKAGGERSMFIIGTSYHTVSLDSGDDPWRRYFPSLLERHGIYKFSKTEGIVLLANPISRAVIAEQARIAGVLRYIWALINVWSTPGDSAAEVRRHKPDEYTARLRAMGGEWERKVLNQAVYFGEMLDYLCAQRQSRRRIIAVGFVGQKSAVRTALEYGGRKSLRETTSRIARLVPDA